MEQKINFQKKLDERLKEIRESSKAPSLLLHSCCGPCSSYVLDYLKDYFEITVLYYNPNIYPEEEYELRLSEQKRLIEEAFSMKAPEGADSTQADSGRLATVRLMTLPYDHMEFLDAVRGLEGEPEGGARCVKCFKLRLNKTAEIAKEQGFDYFGTTLSVSPHKNAMILNQVGHEAEALSGDAVWLESDFKKKSGYLRSIELSKQYDLYRQTYCGCGFSRY